VRVKAWWLQPYTDVAYTYYHSDIGSAGQFESLKRKVQHRAESALARDTRGFRMRRLFARTSDFTSYQLGVISHQSALVKETSHWTRPDLDCSSSYWCTLKAVKILKLLYFPKVAAVPRCSEIQLRSLQKTGRGNVSKYSHMHN